MLKKANFCTCLLVVFCTIVLGNDYENAWMALHKNDIPQAKALLKKAINDPGVAADAYATHLLIATFEGREGRQTDFISSLYQKVKDVNPYLFALWFNKAVLGAYGKKTPAQLSLLEKLLSDKNVNGSLKSAGRYVMSWHLYATNRMDQRYTEYEKMGAVGPAWQMVGTFDNLSGSGFDKEFGPLQHPEAGAVFKSANNAQISWFSPVEMDKDGWTSINAYLQGATAVVYAQCFVEAPGDMKVLLNAGCSGALKIWVNDTPVISASEEAITELDYYKNYVDLKKGYNRLLVKLAYTDIDYPNFIVRFTNDNYETIEGLKYSRAIQQYSRQQTNAAPLHTIKHFAELYFEEKVKNDPDNIVNYLLLNEVYLRNQQTSASRRIMEKLMKKYPDNPLVRFSLLLCYTKEKNRTMLAREIENLKIKNPDCPLAINFRIDEMMNLEKYDEAEKEINKYISAFGEDDDVFEYRIKLLGTQNKIDELVKTIETAYQKDPENARSVELMYNVKTKAYQDMKGGLEVYETYLKKNFDFNISKNLADAYQQQGLPEKQLKILQALAKDFPYDAERLNIIALYYYNQQNYSKAAETGKQVLKLSPYSPTYWENLGFYYQNMQQKNEAIDAFKKAVYFNANKYTSREKIRELQNKPSLWKSFPEYHTDDLVKNAADTIKDHDYYYILNEQLGIVYPEGASEELNTLIIKINNQKGIDSWKESSISYNSNSSYLIIEKAETIKKSGTKTPAEQSNNNIVFTGLEAGDVIVLRYKLQHYLQGRLSSHYWHKFILNSFVPEMTSRFGLMVANNVKINHTTLNTSVTPAISHPEDFTLYTWQLNNVPALKSEPYMPTLGDVGASVTVSTVPDWNTIANWYSDLSAKRTEDDFDVQEVFNTLFPNGVSGLSQKQTAISIYNYIQQNIRYSSVSFRQSAYLPQKPGTTINTGLGDCKDLSALFTALTKMAGIKCNMMLVSTRDYGRNAMDLPSVEFNHCIVKTRLDGSMYYLELTDNNLPFGSLPPGLYKALALTIPSKSDEPGSLQLEQIISPNRVKDIIKRRSSLKVQGDDVEITTDVYKSGALISSLKYTYSDLSKEKQMEEMERTVSSRYKNAITLKDVDFKNIGESSDSLRYSYTYVVQNEVSEVGSMNMFKIPFEDMVATVDNFSASQRKFPVEYWRYEDVDDYETVIDIEIPAGYKFIELPKNQKFTFGNNKYSLEYIVKNPNRMTIQRKSSLQREDIPAAQYPQMKAFLNNIVKAEARYIAFKRK